MKIPIQPLISLVIPLFNEGAGIKQFHAELVKTIAPLTDYGFEIIYCDDGSTDGSRDIVATLAAKDSRIKVVALSRNFGKEYALTAGIKQADGNAVISLDADGQHPVELIPRFIQAWQAGSQVVIGVRNQTGRRSAAFYSLFNRVSGEALISGGTDFRLINRAVREAFLQLQEGGRVTRGWIDWLGFSPTLIPFDVKVRSHGTPTQSTKKLIQLAIHSFVSLSNVPLYIFGFVGIGITLLSSLLGTAVIIEQLLMGDPLKWKFTGTAMLGILILFLVGIILLSQGILAIYISAIYRENKRRPLYIVDRERSVGLDSK